MNMLQATDRWIAAWRFEGRITSDRTEHHYRRVLELHAQDVGNRSPHTTNRDDCLRTLGRWSNPATMVKRRSVLISFYRWTVREGIRKDNPAEQTPAPRVTQTNKYRLTREEVGRMLNAALAERRERWAIHLGFCAGPRSYELRHLRGRHFARPGFIWISPDIGKGGRQRWIPIIEELRPVAVEIIEHVAMDDHVLPGSKAGGGGWGSRDYWREDPQRAMSSQTLQRLTHRIAKRAGIAGHVHPHLMRHAFLHYIARATGDVTISQALAGHADIATTQIYMGEVPIDELQIAVRGLRFTDRGDTVRTHTPARYDTGDPHHHTADGEGGIRTLDSDPPGQ